MMGCLPIQERLPVLLGELIGGPKQHDPKKAMNLCRVITPDLPIREQEAFEAIIRSRMRVSRKRTATVEEFPSRIWRRALTSGSLKRMATAGILARNAMASLIDECVVLAAPADSMTFMVPSGDLPADFDLVGLAPSELSELKLQVITHFENLVLAGRWEMSEGQDIAMTAWIFADTPEGKEAIQLMTDQARSYIQSLSVKMELGPRHHLRRLGKMFYRLGDRRAAMRCGKAIGTSPLHRGWHYQAITSNLHDRIRNRLLRPGINAYQWQYDPTLACSTMSVPLWLKDGVNRLPELMRIFAKTDECPWVFPRLQHIYQWHLAIAGNGEALKGIEMKAPEQSLGLKPPALRLDH